MSEKLNWNYVVQAVGGPAVAGSGTLVVDEYLKLNVVVAANKSLDVEILPGTGSSLQILVISPKTPSEDLSYKVGTDTVVLDGPHVLIGAGATSLLAATVGKLTFTNKNLVKEAELSILAGRKVTP